MVKFAPNRRRGNAKLWGHRRLPIRPRVENGRPLAEDRTFFLEASALLRIVRSDVESWKWEYSLRLAEIWILQSLQVLRCIAMLKLLRGSVETERVVMHICAGRQIYYWNKSTQQSMSRRCLYLCMQVSSYLVYQVLITRLAN